MKDCVYNPPFRMIYHAVFYPTLFENPPKGRIITFILHIWRFLGRITILPIGGYLYTFTFYRVAPILSTFLHSVNLICHLTSLLSTLLCSVHSLTSSHLHPPSYVQSIHSPCLISPM